MSTKPDKSDANSLTPKTVPLVVDYTMGQDTSRQDALDYDPYAEFLRTGYSHFYVEGRQERENIVRAAKAASFLVGVYASFCVVACANDDVLKLQEEENERAAERLSQETP